MAPWSFASPVFTQRPQSVVGDVGASVQLNCEISDGSQVYYFEWRRYPSNNITYTLIDNDIRSAPPERFHRVGQYGLNITSLAASDGAMYRCMFLPSQLNASANVFVIGVYFCLSLLWWLYHI